ncbi:restriction endonuclease subunit S [Lactobacillus kitasatonis]|uniref:restriction endonuclease subunit S n=1 Tax=Lactobacillus kitasatonis TaxID=237446 RepID=UPI0026ED621F|nr:restriction endonuclease subunit S [Lactobacillus kitasatonis]
MKLNVNEWKAYEYSDIFDVRKGFYNKKPEHTVPGKIPFLGATDHHNGVTEYYSKQDIEKASKTGNGKKNEPLDQKIFPPHALCVTNNGAPGYAYYQDKEFTCSHDVNPLYIKNGQFDREVAMFVATVIEQDQYRWQYGRKWRPERMVNSIIKLPQDANGNPDWDYMRKYIKELHYKCITTSVKPKEAPIDTKHWKSYKYSNIFDVCKGFYNKKPEHTAPGKIPFLGATDHHNGVTEYYSKQDIERASKTGNGKKNEPLDQKIFPPHALCVTNNGAPGYAYYQDKEFTCSHDVNPLYIKNGEFNKYTAMFVATVIEQDQYRWQYGRKWRPERMVNSIIKLPQDANGNPDWDYMESYIKNLAYSDKI